MLCWHITIFYELISVSECCHVTTPSLWFQRYRLSRGSQSDKSLKHKHTHTYVYCADSHRERSSYEDDSCNLLRFRLVKSNLNNPGLFCFLFV